MEGRATGLLSLAGLAGAYLIFRYSLLFIHGMKEWPLDLFIVGTAVIFLSGIVFKRTILPVLTAAGYIFGFFAGYCFQFDYGRDGNSMWIIWSGIYLAAVFAGCAAELLIKKRKTGRRERNGSV